MLTLATSVKSHQPSLSLSGIKVAFINATQQLNRLEEIKQQDYPMEVPNPIFHVLLYDGRSGQKTAKNGSHAN
ncbi:MAG: hypothetical protein V7L20_17660 [Nostoc sp.]|uniref:hypothetical protein n=1 Tax=Nostoc sp. TaxID=1180 RepID=UPI002FFC0CD6